MRARWWALGLPLAFASATAALAAPAAATAGGDPAAATAELRQPALAQAAEAPGAARLPIVVSTWAGAGSFSDAAAAAMEVLQAGGSALDAVVEGCSACERLQCDRTVGWGGSPDELGETSLDALVMDGTRMRAGAVANLRRCRHAARAARLVLERTTHTLLAGEQADHFAGEMGLPLQPSLADDWSRQAHEAWCVPGCWAAGLGRGPCRPALACPVCCCTHACRASPQRVLRTRLPLREGGRRNVSPIFGGG